MACAAEAVPTWEAALVEGSVQLEAADQILRGSWLIDLPLVPVIDEDEETDKSFSEVKVFGLHWTGRPLTPADQILVALPLFAVVQGTGQECEVPLYQMGATEALEVGEDTTVMTFSTENSGALPAACEIFGYYTLSATLSAGVLVYLGASPEAEKDPDQDAVLKVLMKNDAGEEVDEVYLTASDGFDGGDPRVIVVPQQAHESVSSHFRGRAAAGKKAALPLKDAPNPPKACAAASTSKTSSSGTFPRGGVSRERAVSALTKTGAPVPSVPKTAAGARKPKTLAELAVTMTSALENFGQRLETLEASNRIGQGAQFGLQGPARDPATALSPPSYEAKGAASSLLSPGRVPLRVSGPPPPIAPPGERAYVQAIRDARALMPSVSPSGPPEGEAVPRQGRDRGVDGALRAAIEQGGETATSAVHLAMLESETLERLTSSADRKPREAKGDTLEELLFGSSPDESGVGNLEGGRKLGGIRGVMGMQRICQSIDQELERWSSLFDQSVYRSLGSDLTGAPWSCHRYGLEKIHWGKHLDLKRFWFLLSSLHALHRSNKVHLLGAKIAQYLKAVEIATAMGGQWTVAWALTGVPDPDPSGSIHNSLASPLEVATAIAFMKDTKILEEASRKIGTGSGQGGGESSGSTSGQGGGCGGGRRPKGQGRGGAGGTEGQGAQPHG
eukprot:324473-Amphidinium_carterae.2